MLLTEARMKLDIRHNLSTASIYAALQLLDA